jgi:large subunit ribosomal protein L19
VSVLDDIVADQIRTDLPPLTPGDTVKVSAKVVEGSRERIQVFEGTVMRLTGGGITRSVTVRALRSGVGVERTFKVNSPRIDHIEVVRHGVARRAKLYFLRDRVGKAATLRERRARGAHAAAMEEHKASIAASAPAKAAKVEKKRPEKVGPVMGGKKGSKRA